MCVCVCVCVCVCFRVDLFKKGVNLVVKELSPLKVCPVPVSCYLPASESQTHTVMTIAVTE